MSIYKSCDIRGEFGVELFPEHARRLGAAIAHMLGPTQILIGGDGRLSTPILKQNLITSLVDNGCHVIDLGILSTPAFYFARKHLAIKPGIVVTASHNPASDNGFKIVLGELPIQEEDIQQIKKLIESPAFTSNQRVGKVKFSGILPVYIQTMQALAPNLEGFRIVVDCADGMAALVASQIWRSTRANTSVINSTVDGNFPHHPPNPAKSENLRQLASRVKALKADLGISYDGDADRVAFVDERGKPLSLDKTIAIFARASLKTYGPAPVIFDQKCSRLVAETILAHGGIPLQEKSGHTFIKSAFLTQDACYAGELSGHHFFKAIGGDDGIYASLIMGEILKNAGQPLSALADELPSYPITPDMRIPMTSGDMDRVLEKLEAFFFGRGSISTVDGFRVELEDGWGLARKSVTEPVMTLRFEGKNEQALDNLITSFVQAAPELKGKLTITKVSNR